MGSERPCREEIDCWKENPVIDQEWVGNWLSVLVDILIDGFGKT